MPNNFDELSQDRRRRRDCPFGFPCDRDRRDNRRDHRRDDRRDHRRDWHDRDNWPWR